VINETPTSWKHVPLFAYGWYTDHPGRRVGLHSAGHVCLPHEQPDAVCSLCGLSVGEIISQALVGQCARTNI